MFFKRAKKAEPESAAQTASAVESKPEASATPPLDVDKLRRNTPTNRLTFKTTSDLSGPAEPFDLKRVQDALRVALASDTSRSHVFVSALPHSGAVAAVAAYAATLNAAIDAKAPDWVDVRNGIASGYTPISVTTGQGRRFAEGVRAVVARLRSVVPYLLQGEDLKLRLEAVEVGFDAVRDDAFARLRAMAEQRNVAILATPMGFAVAPMHEGNVVKPEVLNRLPESMRTEVRRKVESIEGELQALLAEVPSEASGRIAERSELISDYVRPSVTEAFAGLDKEFDGDQSAAAALTAIQNDIIQMACRDSGLVAMLPDYVGRVVANEPSAKPAISIVTAAANTAALSEALIRAGRGVVVIDADQLQALEGGWTTLKSALRDNSVTHPELGAPVALNATVVLVGAAEIAQQLDADTALAKLIHTRTAFAADAARSDDTENALARSIAAAAADRGLPPLDQGAIALLIGESARRAGRPGRLSGDLAPLMALASTAGRAATLASRKTVTDLDVEAALADGRDSGKVRPLFSSTGLPVAGRVHAAGIASAPVEVWATVRPGQGRAADIACSGATAETSGSSAALLWSYLAGRYVPSTPLALAAAIVHEPPLAAAGRTSAAELYALLSALADVAIKPTFVSIGSVTPAGALLPVASINSAIETAFDHFAPRDATQPLSIVIPRANEADLMLRSDVVEAARKDRLKIYSVATADEGLALMTGLPAGVRDGEAPYPEGSLNRLIDDRLAKFARSAAAAEPAATPATAAKVAAR